MVCGNDRLNLDGLVDVLVRTLHIGGGCCAKWFMKDARYSRSLATHTFFCHGMRMKARGCPLLIDRSSRRLAGAGAGAGRLFINGAGHDGV